MKKIFDATATIGRYTNKDGEEKKRYVTIGSVFQDDQGRMSLKLDAVPCGPEWSGWVSFYPVEERGQRSTQRPQERPITPEQERHTKAKQDAYVPATDADKDIPF